MTPMPSRAEAAEQLREQATSCRRLALNARTPRGSRALRAVAEQFDDDALRVDPLPAAAFIALDDGTETALVRARLALERQDALRYAPRSPQIRKS